MTSGNRTSLAGWSGKVSEPATNPFGKDDLVYRALLIGYDSPWNFRAPVRDVVQIDTNRGAFRVSIHAGAARQIWKVEPDPPLPAECADVTDTRIVRFSIPTLEEAVQSRLTAHHGSSSYHRPAPLTGHASVAGSRRPVRPSAPTRPA